MTPKNKTILLKSGVDLRIAGHGTLKRGETKELPADVADSLERNISGVVFADAETKKLPDVETASKAQELAAKLKKKGE